MIIVDFSQVCIATFMAMTNGGKNSDTDLGLIRHMILNSVRLINSKFRNQYGELVFAIDSGNSWRKEVFPYYKANRAEMRKNLDIDWDALFTSIKAVKQELIEIFPYKVIEIERAEADDIIGELTRNNIAEGVHTLIVSGDKDFVQLQVGTHLVSQWDNVRERWIQDQDPKKFLFEHVLKGDRGDGIPNVLSPADAFVNKIRQKPMTQKKLDAFWDSPTDLMGNDRFKINLKIIDLKFTPENIKKQILDTYNNYVVNERKDLFSFFVKRGLKKLAQNIGDF